MADDISQLRSEVAQMEGVSSTWFEWLAGRNELVRILVVEVEFDTDPASSEFRGDVIDAIESKTMAVQNTEGTLQDETTTLVNHLKIVPKRAA